MIDEGIQNGFQIGFEHWKILNCFVVFFIETNIKKEMYFEKHEGYEKMLPTSTRETV